jgi:hypothetical protein
MTVTSPRSPLLTKEVRALAPVFLGTAGVVLLCGFSRTPSLLLPGTAAYVVGTIALGSLAVGHEYINDTLGQLLAQPGDRYALIRMKLGVLAVLLFTLLAIAAPALSGVGDSLTPDLGDAAARMWHWTVLLLPPLLAFGVAPWLSMQCRSPLVAAIFTIALYAAFCVGLRSLTTLSTTGYATDVQSGMTSFVAAAACCGVAALAGRRTFMRLETTGGHQMVAAVVATTSRQRARTLTRAVTRRPIRALLAKEFRLQQLTFAIGGIYALGWALVTTVGRNSYAASSVFGAVTMLYRPFIAVLTGTLACSEERAARTLTLQVLQPYGIRRQWALKVFVVLSLTLAFAVAVPNVLDTLHRNVGGVPSFGVSPRSSGGFGFNVQLNLALFNSYGLLLLLCASSLYVSSLSTTSLNGLLLAIPFGAASIGLSGLLSSTTAVATRSALHLDQLWAANATRYFDIDPIRNALVPRGTWLFNHLGETTFALHAAVAMAWLIPLLVLGLHNYRTSQVSGPTIVRQLRWLLAAMLAVAVISGITNPLLLWYSMKD